MKFIVFRCSQDRDTFVVTDADHVANLKAEKCCPPGNELERIGEFSEMGEDRAAFDENLARNSIGHQGYFVFHSKTYDPVAETPAAMPG